MGKHNYRAMLMVCVSLIGTNAFGDVITTCSVLAEPPQAAQIDSATTSASTAININVNSSLPVLVGAWWLGYGPVPKGAVTGVDLTSCTLNGAAISALTTAVAGDVISCPITAVGGPGITGIEAGLFDSAPVVAGKKTMYGGIIDLYQYDTATPCTPGKGTYWAPPQGATACATTLQNGACPLPASYAFTDAAGAPIAWTSQTAGQALTNVYISMVDAAGLATPPKNKTTVKMQFGLSCHNPTTNAGVKAVFAGVTLPLCTAYGAAPAAWSTTVTLTFTTASATVGPYSFNYDDVGQVELFMSNSATPTKTGTSSRFVVKPAGFVLSGIQQTACVPVPPATTCTPIANPAATTANSARFVRAGEAFTATVTALTSSGVAKANAGTAVDCVTVPADCTPNYGRETVAQSVKLTSALVSPAGGSNPSVGGTFGAFTGGVATGAGFYWGEVGIITLSPSVSSGSYLGAGDVIGTSSGNVGRFYPDHFDTAVTDGCAGCGYTYSGQTFAVQVTAMNSLATPSKTSNYHYDATTGGFAKTVTLADVNAAITPVGVLSSATVPSSAFASGVATVTPSYTFKSSPTVPTVVKMRASDADVTAAGVNEGMTEVRSGRIRIANVHGSELLALPMVAAVQYYDGANWVASVTDNVTSFNTNLVASGGNVSSTIVKGPLTSVSVQGANADPVIKGAKTITLAKPGVAGSVDISLSAPAYLLAGSNGAGVNPSLPGRATFSVYKGNHTFIYQREAY